MRLSRVAAIVVFAGCLLLSITLHAQQTVGWRTDGSGVYPDADPPTVWSKQKNVVWATELPSRSNAQPVIAGDRIFLCTEPFTLLCLNRADGKILWQRTNSYRDVTDKETLAAAGKEMVIAKKLKDRLADIASNVDNLRKTAESTTDKTAREEIDSRIEKLAEQTTTLEQQLTKLSLAAKFTLPKAQMQYNGYTTATPTSDGNRVWAVFGNRVVACYHRDGERQWAAVLPDNPQEMWGHSSSPILVGNTLIVNIEKVVGFNAQTGQQLWVTRYGQSWGSPVRADIGGEDVILLANGRMVRVRDGKILVRVAPLNRPSPVVNGSKAFYIGIQASAYAFPDKITEKVSLKKVWTAEPRGGEFTASPVVHDGLIYGVTSSKILNVLDAETGETVYVKRLNLGSEPAWPSLCVAGSYVYISSRDGTTLVIKTGRTYEEVARNTLEYFIANPTFAGNHLYVRTSNRLYCIGEK